MREKVFVVDQSGKARIVAGKNRTNGQIVFPYPTGEARRGANRAGGATTDQYGWAHHSPLG